MGKTFDLSKIAAQNLGRVEAKTDSASLKPLAHRTYVAMILNPGPSSPGCLTNRIISDVAFTRFIDWMSARGTVKLHGGGDRRVYRYLNWLLIAMDAVGNRVLLEQDGPPRYKREVEYLYGLAEQMVYEKNDVWEDERCGCCPDCLKLNPGDVVGTHPIEANGLHACDPGMSLLDIEVPEDATPYDGDEDEDEIPEDEL